MIKSLWPTMVSYPYMAGAMANGIASEELVIALGKVIFGPFGSGGLRPSVLKRPSK